MQEMAPKLLEQIVHIIKKEYRIHNFAYILQDFINQKFLKSHSCKYLYRIMHDYT